MSLYTETSDEQRIYSMLFHSCLLPESDNLDMPRFRTLFKASGLSKEDLKTLYIEAVKFDDENRMTRAVFGVFCKFLALKMAEYPTTANNLQKQLAVPPFLLDEFERLCTSPPPNPTDTHWSPKFEISEYKAREYVDYICTHLKIDMIDSLDTVVLMAKNAREFFEPFDVENVLKRDLWLYLDRGGENKLQFFFIVMALHFLSLKVEFGVWILDVFKQRDFDERFKKYFNLYMTRSHRCQDINEFFLANFNRPFRVSPSKPIQKQPPTTPPYSERLQMSNETLPAHREHVPPYKVTLPVRREPVEMEEESTNMAAMRMPRAEDRERLEANLRKNSEIDEPRCIPQKQVNCQDYGELYADQEGGAGTEILERLNDADRSQMLENVLGYLTSNVAIHRKRQGEFEEQVSELENEKLKLLAKLDNEREKCKKKLNVQNALIGQLRQLDSTLDSLVQAGFDGDSEKSGPESDSQDEFEQLRLREIKEQLEETYKSHSATMKRILGELGQSGPRQMLVYLEKKLKRYNNDLLGREEQTKEGAHETQRDVNAESEKRGEPDWDSLGEGGYQRFDEKEDEDIFGEMEQMRNRSEEGEEDDNKRAMFQKKAMDIFGNSDED